MRYYGRKTGSRRLLSAVERLVPGTVVLLVILALSGCTEGERGIFATIAIEEEIKKNNLVENASISGMVKADLGGAEYYVVVAGTKVFVRTIAGSDWNEISAPGSTLAQFVAGIDTGATFSPDASTGIMEEVYVVFQSGSSQANTIYRLTNSLGWELAYTPSGFSVDGMIALEGRLLASTTTRQILSWGSGLSGLVTITDATADPDTNTAALFPDGLRDGVRVDTGKFLLVGKNGAFRYASSLSAAASISVPLITGDSGDSPTGVGYSPYGSGVVALTTRQGNVYVTEASGYVPTTNNWNIAVTAGDPTSDIVWVDTLNGGSGAFLIGTTSDAGFNENGNGYYEATISGASGSYSLALSNNLGDNYEGSDLRISSINQFRYFDNGRVFALTNGLGLWTTVYSSGEPRWDWE